MDNAGRIEKPEGEHLLYLVQTTDCGVIHSSQRKVECIAMADDLAATRSRAYVVTETRLYSGEAPKVIYDTRKPEGKTA